MLRWGAGRLEGALHRPVWDPGVAACRDALHAVDRRIAELLAPLAPRHVLDLGCGTGAVALWLAERLPARITGVTLSALQVRLARERASARGLAELCRFLEADFLSLPELEPAGAAYAVESFAHAAEPSAFFAALRPHLVPGGLLVLCDDFLANARPGSRAEARWVERFHAGWRLSSLRTSDEVQRLTPRPFLALRRLLLLLPLLGPAARSSLGGGAALQVCLRRGWVRYRFLVFSLEDG